MVEYELPWNGEPFRSPVIAFDTETPLIEGLEIPDLVLATASDGKRTVVIHPSQLAHFVTDHHDKVWGGFNWAFDYWVVYKFLSPYFAGLWMRIADSGGLLDYMILDQLIRLARGRPEDRRLQKRNLGVVAGEYTGAEVDKENPYRLRFGELLGLPVEEWKSVDRAFFDYAADDAVGTAGLFDPMVVRTSFDLSNANGGHNQFGYLSHDIQVKASIVLADITRRGIAINPTHLNQIESELRDTLTHYHGKMSLLAPGVLKVHKKTGKVKVNKRSTLPELNYTAVQGHLTDAAVDAGVEVVKTAKTGKATTKVEIWSSSLPDHPVVTTWRDLSEAKKSFTFIGPLRGKDVIHPKYNYLVATGRTSSYGPNIQNMPTEPWFRAIFIPRPGNVFVIADYSAIELRTLAAICLARFGKSALADTLGAGRDPHAYTASLINGVDYDEFMTWKETRPQDFKFYRQSAKAINFGVPGGMGTQKLINQARTKYGVDLTVAQAKEFKRRLVMEIYPEVGEYLENDPFEWLAYNTGLSRDTLRELWYGSKFNADLAGSGSGEPEWALWQMEKVIRGNATTVDGRSYTDYVINRSWVFLALVAYALGRKLRKDVRDSINTRTGSPALHAALFSQPAVTLTGRVRAGCEYTEARNTPFQGLAADGAKLALWRSMVEGLPIVAFVHDEIVYEVPRDQVEYARGNVERVMNEEMERVIKPIRSAVEVVTADMWVKA